jgi:hypothetical protein
MNRTLWKFDGLRIAALWLPAAAAVLYFVLSETAPLGEWSFNIEASAAVLGAVTAWRLYSGSAAVRCYLFTRGLSRSRIFWNRWALGMSGTIFVTGLAWLLIICGARATWHRAWGDYDAAYYPMIQFFELRCLPALFGAAATAFCLTAFVVVGRALAITRRSASAWTALRSTRDVIALGMGAMATWYAIEFLISGDDWATAIPAYLTICQSPLCQIVYLVLCPALATWGAAHAWRHLEIAA